MTYSREYGEIRDHKPPPPDETQKAAGEALRRSRVEYDRVMKAYCEDTLPLKALDDRGYKHLRLMCAMSMYNSVFDLWHREFGDLPLEAIKHSLADARALLETACAMADTPWSESHD